MNVENFDKMSLYTDQGNNLHVYNGFNLIPLFWWIISVENKTRWTNKHFLWESKIGSDTKLVVSVPFVL